MSAWPEIDLDAALRAVRAWAPPTPLVAAPGLGAGEGEAPLVLLKLESLQVTGSFKVRGAAARMAALTAEERATGVVACSSGNHGRAVAWVAERAGVHATVCVPSWVDPVKLEAIRRHGATAVLAGDTYDEAEAAVATRVREEGLVEVHPFDDPMVVAGQGTVGLEILQAVPDVGTVVVPLSGGGLVAGVALALKRTRPDVRVVAVSAARARVMMESVRTGRPVALAEEPTLAGALSGGIGLANRWTFPLVRELVDAHVLVDEEAIARAMAFAALRLHLVVEGGGAVGLAALLEGQVTGGGPTVVVVSGGNVSPATLREVSERWGPDL